MGCGGEASGVTLHVQTTRVGYRGEDGLDITRKSGSELGLVFAPSWDILRPALDHRRALEKLDAAALTTGQNAYIRDRVAEPMWRLYAAAFACEMRHSYRRHRRAWDELLGRERVVLLCYCRERARCHRGLVAEMLTKLGAVDEGEVEA